MATEAGDMSRALSLDYRVAQYALRVARVGYMISLQRR